MAIYFALRRSSISFTPDSWAYWQGAVSILEGKGYRYFSGVPIIYFPPLYSLYLAAWTSIIGLSSFALIVANGVTAGIQCAGWMRLAMALTSSSGQQTRAPGYLFAGAFIAMFVPFMESGVLAHNLFYTILPFHILNVLSLLRDPEKGARKQTALLLLSSILMVLAHNSAIVFLTASSIAVLVFRSSSPLLQRLFIAGITFCAPVAVGLASRLYLEQYDSHPFGAGRYSSLEYIQQGVLGLGDLLFLKPTAVVGLPVLAAIMAWFFIFSQRRMTMPLLAIVFTVIPFFLLVAILSVTWITEPLNERFIFFIVLLIIPASLIASSCRPLALAILVALTLPALTARTAHAMLVKAAPAIPDAVAPDWYLSRLPNPGETIIRDGRVHLAPPRFRWG